MDFGGGHGFVCTDKQCSTVGADLQSESVLRTCLTLLITMEFSSAQLRLGLGAHEEVAHATSVPRDHSHPGLTWQEPSLSSLRPVCSTNPCRLRMGKADAPFKSALLLQPSAGVSTAPGSCNAGTAEEVLSLAPSEQTEPRCS